jgi:hypothetical protein
MPPEPTGPPSQRLTAYAEFLPVLRGRLAQFDSRAAGIDDVVTAVLVDEARALMRRIDDQRLWDQIDVLRQPHQAAARAADVLERPDGPLALYRTVLGLQERLNAHVVTRVSWRTLPEAAEIDEPIRRLAEVVALLLAARTNLQAVHSSVMRATEPVPISRRVPELRGFARAAPISIFLLVAGLGLTFGRTIFQGDDFQFTIDDAAILTEIVFVAAVVYLIRLVEESGWRRRSPLGLTRGQTRRENKRRRRLRAELGPTLDRIRELIEGPDGERMWSMIRDAIAPSRLSS